MNPLTYKQAAEDVVSRLKKGVDQEEAIKCAAEARLFADTLCLMANQWGGWMLFTAFCVSFTECKKVLDEAEGIDREAIKGMMEHIIGSFGRTVQ